MKTRQLVLEMKITTSKVNKNGDAFSLIYEINREEKREEEIYRETCEGKPAEL